MKILVTGAAGFIGSHMAERLASLGHEVIGVDSFNKYYARALKEINLAHAQKSGVSFLPIDLAKDDLSSVVKNVAFVYHFAAQPGISNTVPFVAYEENNVLATYRLLEALRTDDALRCFVNIATSSIYGAVATGNENTPPAPTSYYGVTKLAAEQLVMAYYRDKGLPACSARPFSVYGERERPEKLYPKLIKSILEDTEFPLYEGSAEHRRSYTYVGDIVEGLARAIERTDACVGEIFNLGTETSITTGEGIRIIEDILGKKARMKMLPKRAGDQKETCAVIQKAKSLLGYAPTTTAYEGLEKEVLWYKNEVHGKV